MKTEQPVDYYFALRLNVTSTVVIQEPVHACQGDSLTLQCNASATINVIEGRHGMYAVPCDTDCCEPDQFDCSQVMEENNATEWEYLKVLSYSLHKRNSNVCTNVLIHGAGLLCVSIKT